MYLADLGAAGPGPKLELDPTAQLDQVADWMAMRTGLNKSEVMMVLQETNVTSRHVWQVAELVRRLDHDEIRELIRLEPRLQKEVPAERSDLVEWAREQMARYAGEALSMEGEDAFIGDVTVEAYFALPETKRERIWDELYAVAIETAQEREVKPGAVVPAR